MAPIKFDDNIKDKLEKRTLQSSGESWDMLSKKLNAHDKKKSRGLFFYIGIAASVVGVLFVTSLFFNTSEEKSTSSIVVDIEIKDSQNEVKDLTNTESTKKESVTSQKEIIEKNETSTALENALTSTRTKTDVDNISEENKLEKSEQKQFITTIVTEHSVADVKEHSKLKKEIVPVNKLTLEDIKIAQVVGQIEDLVIQNGTVTDAEIDDLLKKAEKEILKQHIYKETIQTVNAQALLQDVEDELEQSFRTKVFEALKSGYKTVKTAVAERNN